MESGPSGSGSGVFTRHFVQSAQSAQTAGTVRGLQDLFAAVEGKVKADTRGKQTPELGKLLTEHMGVLCHGNFVLPEYAAQAGEFKVTRLCASFCP